MWRKDHAGHHATAGDLDRRGLGDVPIHTVPEYTEQPWNGRLGYRLIRNPLILFGFGPLWSMVVNPRRTPNGANRKIRNSVWLTNVALVVVIGALCYFLGWKEFLLVEAPLVPVAGSVGLWLFYVQHNFEGVYWRRNPEWSFGDAALLGSSYLKLPKVLQFFTGNIGFHHVHHLCTRIPSYFLPRAHEENPIFHSAPTLTLGAALRTARLKLYDENTGRLVTWGDLRRDAARARRRRLATAGGYIR
jgi:omega-6 fatty acid desaturase (delta-12 desaturase)